MGNIFGGGGSTPNANTTTNQNAPPPQMAADYQGVVTRATGVANTPYTPPPNEQVAPLSNQTVTGLGNLDQYAYAAQPYLQQAGKMTQQAAQPVGAAQINSYMNPFTSDVIDATQNEFNNQNAQQAQFLNSQNIGAGAFGGDRAGLSQSILAGQQQTAQAPVIAGLNQSNYNQALAESNEQQQNLLAAAGQYGNIGTGAQNAGIQGAGAQIQAGMVPQAEQQAVDNSLSNIWNAGQAYPYQSTGFLANIIEGLGSQSGGSGSTTTPSPSGLSQILGAGTTAAGIGANLFGSAAGGTSAATGIGTFLAGLSDARAKENITPIGKTFDGQTIHKYNFKGDPRTEIGLLAQEVEQRHPEAVHQGGEGLGGLKYLDYDAATREAERAGFDQGGVATGQASPGSTYDLGVGKPFSPAGALALMAPNSGAGAGTGRFGAGNLSMTPGGTLFGHGQPWSGSTVAPQWGGSAGSPQTPLAGPIAPKIQQAGLARGGRAGFEIGGPTGLGNVHMTNIPDTTFVDFATPTAIAQGTGVPDPLSGIANIEFSGAPGTDIGNANNRTQIGSSNLAPSQPNLSGAAPGTVFKPIDYQNPVSDFQTAGAEASLGPHWFTMGKNGELVWGGQGTAPTGTAGAVNKGPLLARPGGPLPTDTPKTETPPPATPAPLAPAPAAPPSTPVASPAALDRGTLDTNGVVWPWQMQGNTGRSWGGPGAGASGGSGTGSSRWTGGRAGYQGGGGLGDLSFYTPETGNARGAAYHPPGLPVPLPPPRPAMIAPRPVARRAPVVRPPVRALAPPMPPPRPSVAVTRPDPSPVAPPMSLPVLNPDETKDPAIRWPDQTYPRPPATQPMDAFPSAADLARIPIGIKAGFDPITGRPRDISEGSDQSGPSWGGNTEARPSFNIGGANAGVMGQWPMAGAMGYTPQGQGVTGQDSQGTPMGGGSTPKASGFDGMFGSGFLRGGRVGFQDGGLSGLGMQPAVQPIPYDILKGITPLQINSKALPTPPGQKDGQQAPADPTKGLGDSLTKLSNGLGGMGGGDALDNMSDADFADVVAPSADEIGMALDFGGFERGGFVRPRFDAGGGATTGSYGGEGDDGPGNSSNNAMGWGVSVNSPGAATGNTGSGGSPGGHSGATGNTGYGGGNTGGNAATAAAAANGPGGTGGGGGTATGGSGPGGGAGLNAATLAMLANNSGAGAGAAPSTSGYGTPSFNLNKALSMIASYANPFGSAQAADLSNNLGGTAGLSDQTKANLATQLRGGFAAPAIGAEGVSTAGVTGDPNKALENMWSATHGGIGADVNANSPYTSPGYAAAVEALKAGFGARGGVGDPGPGAAPGQVAVGTPAVVANPGAPGSPTGFGGFGSPAGLGGPAPSPSNFGGLGQVAALGPSGANATGGSYSRADPVASGEGRHARGGRTSFGLGGLIRPNFLGGGPGPPDPPEPVAPPPVIPPPAPVAASAAPVAAAPAAAPGGKPTREQILEYNRTIAPKYGNDPNVVSKVLGGEMGAKDPYQVGDSGSSFGPWQLHEGGINKANAAMASSGMGDEYKAATGHDPNDPTYWQEQSDFAQQKMKERGLKPWATTAGKLGLPLGPGGGAALASTGGGADQDQQQQVQAQAAMDDAARAPDKKLLPPGIGDTLIMTGAAMMAGTSPHAMTNIGQGIEAGMNYYQKQRELDRDWQKNQAQIEDWHSQARYRDASTNLSVQNLDIERYKAQLDGYRIQLAGWDGTGPMPEPPKPPPSLSMSSAPISKAPAAAAAPATPTIAPKAIPTTAGANVAAAATPVAAGAPPAAATTPDDAKPPSEAPADGEIVPGVKQSDLIDSENPVVIQKQIEVANRKAQLGIPGQAERANALQTRLTALANAPILHTKDGRTIINPAVSQAAAATEAGKIGATQRGEENEEVADRVPQLQTEVQNLEAMRELLKKVPTGWATTNFAQAQNVLATFGIHVGNPGEVRELLKYTTSDIWNNLKEQKGAVRNKEMDAASKMNIDPDGPPDANAEILAKQLGLARLQLQYAKEYSGWDKTNPNTVSPTRFKTDWNLKNNLGDYVTKERRNIAYLGQQVPGPAQREVGQTYMVKTKNGYEPHVWTQEGGQFGWAQ